MSRHEGVSCDSCLKVRLAMNKLFSELNLAICNFEGQLQRPPIQVPCVLRLWLVCSMLRVRNFNQSSLKFSQLESSYAGKISNLPVKAVVADNMFVLSVYLDQSWPWAILFWWKRCRHSAASSPHMSLLWAARLHRDVSGRPRLLGTLRFITWLSGSDMSDLRFHSWWRPKPSPYLVRFLHTHQSGAPLNRPKRPHIILGRAFAVWCRCSTSSTFSRRWGQ